jgi:hypothetical protein
VSFGKTGGAGSEGPNADNIKSSEEEGGSDEEEEEEEDVDERAEEESDANEKVIRFLEGKPLPSGSSKPLKTGGLPEL